VNGEPLNKEVCKKCRSNCIKGWGTFSENAWEISGLVNCPVAPLKMWRRVKAGPPKDCPYKLEHAVMEGKKLEQKI